MGKNRGERKQSSSSTTTTYSSSLKLLWFMVPLIVVSLCFTVLGPKTSNWGFISHYPWLWSFSDSSSSSSSSSSNSAIKNNYMLPMETMEKVVSSKELEEEEDDNNHHASRKVVVGVVSSSEEDEEEALSSSSSNDSMLGGPAVASSPPPLFLQPMQIHQPAINETKHGGLDVSTNETLQINPTMNDSNASLKKARVQREYSNLERLEAGLRRSRFAIREAKNGSQLQDPDYVPLGPMYWNAKGFHRSYLEMEKQFKVFVYPEGEPPVFHNGPCKSIYSMEGNFIHTMEIDSQFRTNNPEKAHAYFLPFSVAMLVQFVYVRDSHDFHPIKQTVVDYLNVIAGKYPYWNRSLAADHFMLACHDWGPETSFSNPFLGKNSIRVLCNANTSEGFNPTKDVSFPEINLQTGGTRGLLGGPSPSQRPILAFFAGGLHGPIRPVLLEHWENKDEDIRVHRYLPKGVSYYDMMRKTKYCICPSGYEVASPRVVEALYTGCVPVLISDHYVPPFSDVLNWKSFSVEVPVKEVPNLKKILMGISSSQYIRMQRRGVQVRRHFEVNSPPKRYDVYHMILHSVWLRRLNLQVQD